MKCQHCNFENADDSKFCQNCGQEIAAEPAAAPVEEPIAEPTPVAAEPTPTAEPTPAAPKKKELPLRPIIYGVAAIVVLILLIFLFRSCGGEAFTPAENSVRTFVKDESSVIVLNEEIVDFDLDGTIDSRYASLLGDVSAFTVENEYDEEIGYTYTLYAMRGEKVATVAEDVLDYELSVGGNTIAYIDSDNALMLYTVKNGKSEKIADEASGGLALSPNGKVVAYSVVDEDDDEMESELFIYKGGKSESIGKNLGCVAVNDSAKLIYLVDEESDSLYVMQLGKEKSKLAAEVDSSFVLNEDHSQLLFSVNDKCYITVNGKEKEKFGSGMMLVPLAARSGLCAYTMSGSYSAVTCAMDKFAENVYIDMGDSDISYVNKKYESDKLASTASDAYLTKDGKTLIYLRDGTVTKVPVKDPEDTTRLAEDVVSLLVSDDGKYIYYINDDEELWSKKGKSDAKKIADEVSSACITDENVVLFLTDYSDEDSSGMLYYSKNGGEKKKIADDIRSVSASTSAFYTTKADEGLYDVYVSKGNAKFELLIEEAGYDTSDEYYYDDYNY